jgi:hypothetical protein
MKVEYIQKPFAPFKIVVETPEDLSLLSSIVSSAETHELRYGYMRSENCFYKAVQRFKELIKNPT